MEFRWNDWNTEHVAIDREGKAPFWPPEEAMKQKRHWEMSAEELAAATSQFDEPLSADKSRPLTKDEREQWNRVKRKRGRPRTGQGFERISVSLEKGLLRRATALARKRRLSRSRLVALALEQTLAGEK
jgi:hypothetical protein